MAGKRKTPDNESPSQELLKEGADSAQSQKDTTPEGKKKTTSRPRKKSTKAETLVNPEPVEIDPIAEMQSIYEAGLNDPIVVRPEGSLAGVKAEADRATEPDGSLIPIKGIDEKREAILARIGIGSTDDLMLRCRTIAQRKTVAARVMREEKGVPDTPAEKARWEEAYQRYVASWVKQVDLWRVSGMDVNTAYFLVQLGVRHVEDLVKVDPNKAFTMINCLSNAQPEYTPPSLEKLTQLVANASKASPRYPYYQDRLDSALSNYLTQLNAQFSTVLSNGLRGAPLGHAPLKFGGIKLEDILGGSSIETDDPAPTFLFREAEVDNTQSNSLEQIRKGVDFLKDIEMVLPLPRMIRGKVYMVKSGEVLPDSERERASYVLHNAVVEVEGISSPTEDKSENAENPRGYTDAAGSFVIVLPEKYNMKETLTLSVSQGPFKQSFILSAGDIPSHVAEQATIHSFNQLAVLDQNRKDDEAKLAFLEEMRRKMAQDTILTAQEQAAYAQYSAQEEELRQEYADAGEKIQDLKAQINMTDRSTILLERVLSNLLARTDLVADFSQEPFIVNEDIFTGYVPGQKKVLPSVKLMEKDDVPVYLPTDTAPSRVFYYSMLQRLVEPDISPVADEKNKSGRKALRQGVDVMDFKNKLATAPDKWPQMSSLGIGYTLNMHQAWVPDGFALGNLLYSLVLAPGEEQRLIVREKAQSYAIEDTAEGADQTAERYTGSQTDNTAAAYEYALRQLSEGKSNMDYNTSTSSLGISAGAGGSYSGASAMLGLSWGKSSSKGSGSSSASQSNSHGEASNAAQQFQHSIKSASEKISQAKRLSVSMATGSETDSVATRIIANHNHSHTMTIQYWEVMRRYRLETCVDNVELVLFVPLKMIKFLGGANPSYTLDSASMTPALFRSRYDVLLRYADALEGALPNKYRGGMALIRRFTSLPDWKMESRDTAEKEVIVTLKGCFLTCDDLRATLVLKHGKGSVSGTVKYTRLTLNKHFYTTSELKDAIKSIRNEVSLSDLTNYNDYNNDADKTCTCTFVLPGSVQTDDISYVRIDYSCESLHYELHKYSKELDASNALASETYEKMLSRMWDLAKDNDNSSNDQKMIAYYKQLLPEAWITPNVTLTSQEMRNLGAPTISLVSITCNNKSLSGTLSGNHLFSSQRVSVWSDKPTLTYAQLQQTEDTLHHIVSNTMQYSQVIWASLTPDERAVMLEQYTIEMDFQGLEGDGSTGGYNDISLLNCINVKKLLGFYGNCMLFPFSYPQELAEALGKTAAELQDSLYRYHTNYFRVPSTTISLPTDGMVGEAVLGATNVSEEIDLTRFWNWKDSPIDSMSLDSSYLNNTDYLAGKTTKDISALNIQGAAAPTAVTTADLISALVGKQTPTFDNITGLDQLKEVLNKATETTATGRDKALESSGEMAKAALEYAFKSEELKQKQKESESEDTTDDSSNGGGGNNGGGSNNGGGTTNSGGNGGGSAPTPEPAPEPSPEPDPTPGPSPAPDPGTESAPDPKPEDTEDSPETDVDEEDEEEDDGVVYYDMEEAARQDCPAVPDGVNPELAETLISALLSFVESGKYATVEECISALTGCNMSAERLNASAEDACRKYGIQIQEGGEG